MDIKSADISISNNNCNCNKLRTADASSYSVTLLHLGSEKSDGEKNQLFGGGGYSFTIIAFKLGCLEPFVLPG